MCETRTLRASTLVALLSTGTGYTLLSHGRPRAAAAGAFHGHPSTGCNSLSPLKSKPYRWRSAPIPARLCAIAVEHGTYGHDQEQLDDQEGVSSGPSLRRPNEQTNGQPCGKENAPPATTGLATESNVMVAAKASEVRQEVMDGGVDGGAGGNAKCSPIDGDEARPAASTSRLETGLDKGLGIESGSTERDGVRRVRASEQLPRQRESSERGKLPPERSDSSFDVVVATKSIEARTGTFPSPDGGGVNGAPNCEQAVSQTIDVGFGVASQAQGTSLKDSGRYREVRVPKEEEEKAGAVTGRKEVENQGGERKKGVVFRMSRVSLGMRWKKRVTFALRTVQIWAFLLHVLVKLFRQKLVQKDEARMSARRRKLGRYLCRAFLKLGPTFIKIGQLLSTRVDLLSTEYIEELSQLQDDVPGFGGEKAMKIIERELGAPVSELFDSFNSTPLAAASLGQVHEAWLDGQRYAVKVQRPGLEDLFEVDLNSIGALASVLDRFDPKLDGASRDWGAIFRESKRVLFEEVDYTREGKNAERFSENFKGTAWIKAPCINWSRTTRKVLCMEFLKGIKISDLEKIDEAGIDRSLLATRIAECYLAQLCRHGFFHCDPHPGNLACDAVGGGRIIFYDFGMMDELVDSLKREFVNLMFGIYGNDVKEVVDALESMDVIRKGADRLTVERITRFYLGEFQATLTKGGKFINQLNAEEEKALVRRERAKIGQDLFSGTAAVPLQFPASFTFVFRAFTTLDGIGKKLDPGYDLTKIASPYLKQLLDLKDGSAFLSVLRTWQKRLGWRGQDVASVVQSPRRVKHVNDVVTQLEAGDLRLRVRVLEAEAAFARIEAVQGSLTAAVLATLFLNAGVILAGSTTPPAVVGSRALFAFAGFFGVQIPVGYLKVWQLKRQADNAKGFR